MSEEAGQVLDGGQRQEYGNAQQTRALDRRKSRLPVTRGVMTGRDNEDHLPNS